MSKFDLQAYLTKGINNMVDGILRSTIKNPQASKFLMQFALESKRAEKRREAEEKKGNHIPAFLISSITTTCNLHCKGCYARANHSCFDSTNIGGPSMLSANQWEDIFSQAADLGICFSLLIGGEPFVRKEVLLAAAKEKRMLFPIFTNGTMINDAYLDLLKKNRNLVPVLSIEGKEETTDARRGKGIYNKLKETMRALDKEKIMYGASITVHKNNLEEVLSDEFIKELSESGCKAVIYVEYIPTTEETRNIVLGDTERERLANRLTAIRKEREDMIFVSFPGDEKSSGGCLAAGRGFFHINAFGGVEPCPFSPYSDTSLLQVSLKEALKSPFFHKLMEQGALLQEHMTGCVLFEQEEQVKSLLKEAVE